MVTMLFQLVLALWLMRSTVAPAILRRVAVAGGAAAGAVFLAIQYVPGFADTLSNQFSLDQSLNGISSGRVGILGDSVSAFVNGPILGQGLGDRVGATGLPLTDPHDAFLDFLIAFGPVLGFIVCLAFLVVGLHWLLREADPSLTRKKRFVGLGVYGVYPLFMVESSVSGTLLLPIILLLFGLNAAVFARVREEHPVGGTRRDRRRWSVQPGFRR
jgi:O-antigen ligase